MIKVEEFGAVAVVTYDRGERRNALSLKAMNELIRVADSFQDRFDISAVVLAGSSVIESGVPATNITLSWPTFTAAADEAGISRLYGGIHFRNGDLEGRKLGRKVGAQAHSLAVAYANGTAGN